MILKRIKLKKKAIKDLYTKIKKVKTVKIMAKSGPKGKLFGSVNKKTICKSILDSKKINIPKDYICMKEEIKNLGKYKIEINIPNQESFEISVEIIEQG